MMVRNITRRHTREDLCLIEMLGPPNDLSRESHCNFFFSLAFFLPSGFPSIYPQLSCPPARNLHVFSCLYFY
jgi:hypothetical protein